MINIEIDIKLPELWKDKTFAKKDWGAINLIVGSNGTGKSLFADQLNIQLKNKGYQVRLLNAERLSGFEKKSYSYFQSGSLEQGLHIGNFEQLKSNGEAFGLSSSAFIILKERLDIRIKIEAILSDIFNKTIRLVEIGGFLKPMIQDISGSIEYGMKETECHGLKELLTILTFVYDNSKNCLILDEPELHLHPQFQSFLLNEIRAISGDPMTDSSKKLFFIITHSPYFLDLRNINDFKSILVSHYNSPPTSVEELDGQDKYILKRFLPRFNTHHKQFFFSPNPVFVEGYTDQQIITLLFDRLDYKISASGSSIIDVGGKDELAVFFNLCKKLKISGRIIADLDALLKGKLREVVQSDLRANKYIQDNGLGTDVSSLIGDLERKLKAIADNLVTKTTIDPDLNHAILYLKTIITIADKRHEVMISTLLILQRYKEKILTIVSLSVIDSVNYVLPRFELLLNVFKASNVFIIPKGEIEHYYTQTKIDYLNFNDNQKNLAFHTERDYILSEVNITTLENTYSELMKILRDSVPQIKVDISKHIKYQLIEWIQKVQNAVVKNEVKDLTSLINHGNVDYKFFNQIIDISEFKLEQDGRFLCKVILKPSLIREVNEVIFNERTIAHEFQLNI